jgi:hypothetical protein
MHRRLAFTITTLLACASPAHAGTFLTNQLEGPIDATLGKLRGLNKMGSWRRAWAGRSFRRAFQALQRTADKLDRDYNDLAMKTLVREIHALNEGLASGRLSLAAAGQGLVFARAKVDTGLAELQRRSDFYFEQDLPRALRSAPRRLAQLKETMTAADHQGWSAGRVMTALGKSFMERYPGTVGWALVKRAHARSAERVTRRWARIAWKRLSGNRAPASRARLNQMARALGQRAAYRAMDAETAFHGLSRPLYSRRR